MNDLERLASRGDERGAGTVFERATNGPTVSDRSARPLALVGAAVVVVVAVLVALVVRDVDDPPQDLFADVPPPEAVFYAETDTTLVFDDGDAGVIALDLDTGTVQPRPVGNQAGDQPFRLLRTGNRLVVGWRQARSVPAVTEPVELGTDVLVLPAIQAGSVWLADVDEPRTIRRVSVVDGGVLEGPFDVRPGELPLRGVAGGMAYDTPDGVVVRAGDGSAYPWSLGRVLGDASGSHVAYCDTTEPCTAGTIVDLGTDDEISFASPDGGKPMDIAGSRFSPDGSTLAVAAGEDLVLVDVATAVRTVVEPEGFTGIIHLAWSDDGSQLFWSTDSYMRDETTLGRYEVATGDDQHRTLDVGGLLSFVATPSAPPTDVDLRTFARGETAAPAFAPQVDLLLGRDVVATRTPTDLATPAGWVLDGESALRFLAVTEVATRPGPTGASTTTTQPRSGCGDTLPEPDGIEYDGHVVLEPATIESCLDWFAVEVFTLRGEIVGVSLDRREP